MASPTPEIARFMDNNAQFVKSYGTPPTMTQMRSVMLNNPNAGALAILTCLDPRVVPAQFFGPGMQSAVIRNAGGRPTDDAVASMVMLRSLGNLTNVIVLHHTDCGMTHLTQEQIVKEAKERVKKAPGGVEDVGEWIEGRDYGCFKAEEMESTVMKDVEKLRRLEVLRSVGIWGMVMDTATGVVKEVDV